MPTTKQHLVEIYVSSGGEEGEAEAVLEQLAGRQPDVSIDTLMGTGTMRIYHVTMDDGRRYTVGDGLPEPWVFRGKIHPAYVLVYNAVWSHEGDMEFNGPCDGPKNADELHEDLAWWAVRDWWDDPNNPKKEPRFAPTDQEVDEYLRQDIPPQPPEDLGEE